MDVVRARKRANTSHKSEKCTADDIRENAKPRRRVEMNVQNKNKKNRKNRTRPNGAADRYLRPRRSGFLCFPRQTDGLL